jgi:hypothetical protein
MRGSSSSARPQSAKRKERSLDSIRLGTESSNPSPSSGESANQRSLCCGVPSTFSPAGTWPGFNERLERRPRAMPGAGGILPSRPTDSSIIMPRQPRGIEPPLFRRKRDQHRCATHESHPKRQKRYSAPPSRVCWFEEPQRFGTEVSRPFPRITADRAVCKRCKSAAPFAECRQSPPSKRGASAQRSVSNRMPHPLL